MSRRTQRREEFTGIAARMIASKGNHGVRISDIAEAAGVSKGSVFYHFAERDDLMLETYRRAVEEFHERRVSALSEISDPVEQLATGILMWVPEDDEDSGWRLLLELCVQALRSTPHRVLMKSLYDRSEDLYTSIIEAGSRSGQLELRQSARTIARTVCSLEDIAGIYLSVGCQHEASRVLTPIVEYFELATGCQLPVLKEL